MCAGGAKLNVPPFRRIARNLPAPPPPESFLAAPAGALALRLGADEQGGGRGWRDCRPAYNVSCRAILSSMLIRFSSTALGMASADRRIGWRRKAACHLR